MAEKIIITKDITTVQTLPLTQNALGVVGGELAQGTINPNGVIEKGNNNAVSGGEVYKTTELINNVVGIDFVNENPYFLDGVNNWEKNDNSFTFIPNNGMAYYYTEDSTNTGIMQTISLKSGVKYIVEVELSRLNSNIISGSVGLYPLFSSVFNIDSDGWQKITHEFTVSADNDYLFLFAVWTPYSEFNIKSIIIREKTSDSIIDVSEKSFNYLNDYENYKWFPKKSFNKTILQDYLSNFISKYNQQKQDVTIVQIGDSISTDLNWTEKRTDANVRPPFCTEYNVNSYLEEKLRWNGQEYKRFDNVGVFTENLGGGTSTIKNTDTYWGAVGDAYYLPTTKVIDNGLNASISFKIPSGINRLNLILHTDCQWTESSQIFIGQGYGFVEVFDGNNWVEANGFITYQKEPDTLSSLGFYKDNAQKRLKFRSVNGLTEKNIEFRNIGEGRLAYWGIEYTPNDYFFTYICASKGSHSISMLKRYQSWMVDSFNPDLILWQLPILNESLGQSSRGFGSDEYSDVFLNYYSELSSNYLVLPYIAWAAEYSNFIDLNGNFLTSRTLSGEFVSCQADVNNLQYNFENINVPCINAFNLFTQIGIEKANFEKGNLYTNALNESGKNGNTFTTDGIHLNKLGEDVLYNILHDNFNF